MIKIENIKYWIWLSLLKGIGSRKCLTLLEKYQTPEKIYHLTKEELVNVKGIGETAADIISCQITKQKIDKHLQYLERNQIEVIHIQDKSYPPLLKEIYDPPIVIYLKGNKKILKEKSLAIVGCRDATDYGRKAAKYFAYQLAKQGIHIVSGLAKGVDSYAHIGTILARNVDSYPQKEKLSTIGKTIAVLGCGLDTIYPQENKKLANQIIETGGAIITEYPLGTKPEKSNFPARNRIISGLSKGVLVIEAKERSGSLITVDFALEQGRDVFCVPGNINSQNSIGTNELIKQGAMLVTNAKDIIGDRSHWT